MNKYLVITIDVEPDCSATWHYSNPLGFRGVSEGIAERLHPLFIKYNIVPTYLINNVVLEDGKSIMVFKNLPGKFELGTHLHPEFIEPDKRFTNYAGQKGTANCCFYPPDIEREKIKSITRLFEEQFGYKPTSFRAGRYSAGANTIKSLTELGYLVDTSVTPHICWKDSTREKPVDYTHAPEQPYFIDEGAITWQDKNGRLLQVPVSIALKARNRFKELIVSMAGMRHSRRSHKVLWLRPWYSNTEEMIFICDQFAAKYQSNDTVVFNMMFHNVEALPGLSPYTKTENDSARYLQQLEQFFIFCNQQNIISVGISDLYHVFKKE